MPRISRKDSILISKKTPVQILPIIHAGIYLRLSVSRFGTKTDSIENQRVLIKQYVSQRKDIKIIQEYIDNGITGTNFSRSGFEKMLDDIKEGKINCVIVKDLSRFGRNFEETEKYITVIFPFMNVFFISVNDKFDTSDPSCDRNNLIIALKNLLNDLYARETSQKVSNTFNRLRREGKYLGTRPPYGYLINPQYHKSLIVENETADIVREIFYRILKDESYYSIVNWLNKNKISPPFKHCYELGLFHTDKYKNADKWFRSTIKGIAENPVYYGALVVSKHKQSLCSNIPFHKIPKNEWNIIENTHEPIVNKELFLKVQQNIENREKKAKKKEKDSFPYRIENIFCKKVICGYCKRLMKRTFYTLVNKQRKYYFCCMDYCSTKGKIDCCNGYIQEDVLKSLVLETIKNEMKINIELKNLIKNIESEKLNNQKDTELERLKLQNEIGKITTIKRNIYQDFKLGILEKEEYIYRKKNLNIKIQELSENLNKIQEKIHLIKQKFDFKKKYIETFQKFKGFYEITDEIVKELVDKIEVYYSNKISITFKYRDIFKNQINNIQKEMKQFVL